MIDKKTKDNIENLYSQGSSIRDIAKTLNLNRELVRRYIKGKVKVKNTIKNIYDTNMTQVTQENLTDTEMTQKRHNELKKEILTQVNNQLLDFKSNFPESISIDDLNTYKRDIKNFINESIEEALINVSKDIIELENKLNNLYNSIESINKLLEIPLK